VAAQASALAVIVAFVQTILSGIAGIGVVHDYQPVALTPGEIPAAMQVAGLIHFWSITTESTLEAWLTNEAVLLTHDLVLRGYRQVRAPAVDDPAFQALTSTVGDVFRPQYTIPTPTTAELLGPLQIPVRGQHRMLAETWLVHYSECHLKATERVTLI